MARARELRPQARTQLDALRDNLAQLERSLPNIRGMGHRATELLHRLDTVHEDMARLREIDGDIDLRPEETRLAYIEERMRGDRAAALVREIGRTVGWETLRAQAMPQNGQWWWYLDEELAHRRRAEIRRWLLRAGLTLVALVLLVGAYRLFLAPSPEVARKVALTQRAERYIEQGDLDQALARYEEAAAGDPNDPELQVWLGVLYGQTGQPGEAVAAFQSARRLSPSLHTYFLLRARVYLQLGMPDEAAGDVLAALHSDPDSSQALFMLADALERQGHYQEAMDLFQKVSLMAEDPSLQVLAKVRYGMLLEAGPRASSAAPTAEEAGP